MNDTDHLLVRHLFYELRADLALSNAPHSPEETGVPTSSKSEKNVPKLVKYFFPSCKEWTGVWSSKYQDCLPFGRKNVDNMGLTLNLYNYYNYYKFFYTAYKEDCQDPKNL